MDPEAGEEENSLIPVNVSKSFEAGNLGPKSSTAEMKEKMTVTRNFLYKHEKMEKANKTKPRAFKSLQSLLQDAAGFWTVQPRLRMFNFASSPNNKHCPC